MTVAAVILAAGAGSRFEGNAHKLLSDLDGRPVVRWVIDEVNAAGFNAVYLVWGAVALDTALYGVDLLSAGFRPVHSPRWAEGQSHSLQAGVAAAAADGHDSVVVGLGDQPLVPASAWRSVGSAAGAIVSAEFDGERRPPVKLERSVWDLLPDSGDAGARALMTLRPDLVLAVPCSGNAADIDTLEDLDDLEQTIGS